MTLSAANKTVSLVLGSGGARGLAHIGVIHWLREHGYEIRSISGCSIGALVGAVYALGRLDEFESWVRAISKRDIFALLDLSWEAAGIFKGDRLLDALEELLGDTLIEDLPIPFTAVAANLETGKEVWLDNGSLLDAIRASISIPLFFTPFKYKGKTLIDGGVLNPVPIAPTFGDFSDLTVAVNVSGELKHFKNNQKSHVNHVEPSSRLQHKISQYIEEMKRRATNYLSADLDMIDIAYQSFDAMQGVIARQKLAAHPPDVTIEIPRNACGILDFDQAEEMIEFGYRRAREALANHRNK